MSAKEIENEIRLFASKYGHRLFRCNVGRAWQGKKVDSSCPTCNPANSKSIIKLLHPRVFHGHAEGTPDLNGWTMVEILPEMVGKQLPIFTAVEIKTAGDRLKPSQKKILAYLQKIGAICGVARSVTDFKGILRGWYQGLERGGKDTSS